MTHGTLVAKQQIPNFKQLLMLGYLTGKLNQDFMCQQTACTLTLKETPHVSCIRSPPGLEVISTNFAVTHIQLCDCLVHAQGISQGLRKNGVSIASLIDFLGRKEGFEAISYLHTIKCNSCKSKLYMYGCVVVPEYQENWITLAEIRRE